MSFKNNSYAIRIQAFIESEIEKTVSVQSYFWSSPRVVNPPLSVSVNPDGSNRLILDL